MSNYLSGFSSRVANLRQNLLAGESDGPSPQETNIARALRGYYTEQGRTFNPITRDGRRDERLNIYTEAAVAAQPVQAVYVPTQPGQGRPFQPRPDFNKSNSTGTPNPFDNMRAKKTLQPPADRLKERTLGPRQTSYESASSDGGYSARAPKNTYVPQNDRNNSYDRPSRGAEKPYVAASQPWSSQPNEFEGGYSEPAPVNNYAPVKNVGARRPGGGLPSGPGGNRAIGLPTGPRGKKF